MGTEQLSPAPGGWDHCRAFVCVWAGGCPETLGPLHRKPLTLHPTCSIQARHHAELETDPQASKGTDGTMEVGPEETVALSTGWVRSTVPGASSACHHVPGLNQCQHELLLFTQLASLQPGQHGAEAPGAEGTSREPAEQSQVSRAGLCPPLLGRLGAVSCQDGLQPCPEVREGSGRDQTSCLSQGGQWGPS